MAWHKGYLLVAILLVTSFSNLLVANTVMMMGVSIPQGLRLLASLAFSGGLTVLFAGSLIRQAQSSARTAEELRRRVFRDRLTDVSTRDFLFERLSRCPRVSGIVLMVDIDHFKRMNDTHGHMAGDQVIRTVANALRVQCRTEDIVCRFGGEEFLIFLPGSDEAHGKDVAERLRASVKDAYTDFDGQKLRVTISVGAAMKAQEETIDMAIRAADDALYQAKRCGRDRVALSWEPRMPDHTCPLSSEVLCPIRPTAAEHWPHNA
ncbi:diguanylate cyclase (GGDEF)-like protein [Sagittula marina]|uniref:diguanylate cyclase n=1 Tax=Sagittula marina TaxID=943940 RepID=A0A7W6DRP5_9RHOB|nr:GGDEF domain-containing protein [Sagittula marina]MBB3985632.1 diguanylate cyclase (GGDEF)-like protein [Sagittula marina]